MDGIKPIVKLLRKKLMIKFELYLKEEKILLDKREGITVRQLADFDKAKSEWETAVQKYNDHLTFLRANRITLLPEKN
jgi:hypothetical protein